MSKSQFVVAEGHLEMLEKNWESGADCVNEVVADGFNLFRIFCERGRDGMVFDLWSKLPNFHKSKLTQTENFANVLEASAKSGNVELVRFFSQKAKITISLLPCILDTAARGGYVDVFRFLLSELDLPGTRAYTYKYFYANQQFQYEK